MGQDYDFFATGQGAMPTPGPTPPAPTRAPRQFGSATDPGGRPVNQFGTPVDLASSPVGPAAAPGYGAAPFDGPGVGGSWAPSAPAHRMPPGGHAGAAGTRPGQVTAAGIIAIVQGVLALFVSLLGFAAMSAMESGFGVEGAALVRGVSSIVRLVLFAVLLVAVLYIVVGAATAAGRRWAAWTLLVVESVGLVLGVLGLAESSTQSGGPFGQLVSLVIPVAVIVLLVLPRSWAWLRTG